MNLNKYLSEELVWLLLGFFQTGYGDRVHYVVNVPHTMAEQYGWYGLATNVFLLLSQGEEGDQGPIGEVGAQGPPVKYFLLKCYSFAS